MVVTICEREFTLKECTVATCTVFMEGNDIIDLQIDKIEFWDHEIVDMADDWHDWLVKYILERKDELV